MNWWEKLYDENLATILLDPAAGDELRKTVLFLSNVLELDHSIVFDQCCGDQAELYIQSAKKRETGASFEVGDAFQYITPTLCDAAFNWWTSFGYHSNDEVNSLMLKRALDSLKNGGKYALDYMNIPNLYQNFKKDVVIEQPLDGGVLTLLRESELDLLNDALLKTWTYTLPDGEKVVYESHTRLYTAIQLKEFFSRVGFINIKFFGDIDESPLTIESPRCIIIGEKP